MQRSFSVDEVPFEMQRSECLYGMKLVGEWSDVENSSLTVFICNAFAICLAPSSQIKLCIKSSVVSVCVK